MFTKLYGFIYITTNIINGRKYIGQKKYDSNGKWKNYLGSGVIFKQAIDKYGKDNFKREIIDISFSLNELNKKEEYYIDQYDAVDNKSFYNLVKGGGTVKGFKHTKETKKKLSLHFSGENNFFYGKRYYGSDNGFYGKRHTLESRKLMSESHKGQKVWNKGLTDIYSDETLLKMSNAKKGIPLSKEHIKNIKKSQQGKNHPRLNKKHSESSKQKMRESRLGKKHSDESREKMSKSQKERYRNKPCKSKGEHHASRKVICITTNVSFDSIIEASEFYSCNKGSISRCCNGNLKTCGKLDDGTRLKWKYLD